MCGCFISSCGSPSATMRPCSSTMISSAPTMVESRCAITSDVRPSSARSSAIATAASRREFFEHCTVADIDGVRATAVAEGTGDQRFAAATVDASDAGAIAELARSVRADVVMNAADPRFVMPIFDAAFAADAHSLDMAMSLSRRHPTEPFSRTGVMLGDEQFARSAHVVAEGACNEVPNTLVL